MDSKDRNLGMNSHITRRDFINGVAVAVGASMVPGGLAMAQDSGPDPSAQEPLLAQGITQDDPRYYPPALTGMRGSHPGSFEVAHEMRDDGKWDLSTAEDTGETYDLVVVGGGISGLAAAHYFVKNVGRSAKVLVLDNHDDFGGHAKRNEFSYNGRTLALNGGTLNIESPDRYNQPAKQLLEAVGIDLDRYLDENSKNRQLYSSLGLGNAYFFNKETWGADKLVKVAGATGTGEEGAAAARRTMGGITEDFIGRTPLSEQAKKDMLRIYSKEQPDYMPGMSAAEKQVRLAKMSYQDYLLNVAKADPQCLWFVKHTGEGNFCVGADAIPALFAAQGYGSPGFSGLNLNPLPNGLLEDLPGGQHGRQVPGRMAVHFPDGNATVARLLVRWLVPDAVPGTTMESVGLCRINYSLLDKPGQTARIRLNSTVVNVHHDGPYGEAKGVVVSYVRSGKTYQVKGQACVMACWNMFIPMIVPELPAEQKKALAYGVKGPLVYTSVAVKNWTAFQKLGIRSVSAPDMFHDNVSLAEAVSLGDLHHPQTPDEPVVLHMSKIPTAPGKPRKEQHHIGRMLLYTTTFETFERNIRDQLTRTLGDGGFDPARDIVAITVNRWPHGYAYTYNSLFEPMDWVYTQTDARPCVAARKPYGLITIANSDAAASPHTDAAMLEAHRAVQQVLERRAWPMLTQTSAG
ncbi:MAG TPA: NAD(P)-binding protein [Candidatus Acidoferrales bacterium]|jgi:spermidine dehydrogenase|nr:NAD(P)-binding protein [Candidatus Acidoferrales bacterium]